MTARLTLSDPLVKDLAQAACRHERQYNAIPKLQGEANWQEWSDALQHAALLAGTDAVLNGESLHPQSLEDKQITTTEWNDNIKRIAVWRSRNETLLKAIASNSNVKLEEFEGLNAHKTYLGLKSKYRVSEDQGVLNIYNQHLMLGGTTLEECPREIAKKLQIAFDQYNTLAGHNIAQHLPTNIMKLEFLRSLETPYVNWRRELLKERKVLELDQGPALTFRELVDLVVEERNRILQERRATKSLSVIIPHTAILIPIKNVSRKILVYVLGTGDPARVTRSILQVIRISGAFKQKLKPATVYLQGT
ncbi:hypothetical protein E4T47_01487 [Aureobasidium subglaciale]|nr:hypothetical protein E4T47_01487 [Aureobasidium subglaciale]